MAVKLAYMEVTGTFLKRAVTIREIRTHISWNLYPVVYRDMVM
jgi:hypothetical protein